MTRSLSCGLCSLETGFSSFFILFLVIYYDEQYIEQESAHFDILLFIVLANYPRRLLVRHIGHAGDSALSAKSLTGSTERCFYAPCNQLGIGYYVFPIRRRGGVSEIPADSVDGLSLSWRCSSCTQSYPFKNRWRSEPVVGMK